MLHALGYEETKKNLILLGESDCIGKSFRRSSKLCSYQLASRNFLFQWPVRHGVPRGGEILLHGVRGQVHQEEASVDEPEGRGQGGHPEGDSDPG